MYVPYTSIIIPYLPGFVCGLVHETHTKNKRCGYLLVSQSFSLLGSWDCASAAVQACVPHIGHFNDGQARQCGILLAVAMNFQVSWSKTFNDFDVSHTLGLDSSQ